MKHVTPLVCAIVVLVTVTVACKKSVEPVAAIQPAIEQAAVTPFRNVVVCDWAPDYGDSILYVTAGKSDAVVLPVNRGTSGQGKYCSWPTGLHIDSLTGAINPAKSETGMRYMVGFIKTGSSDTCFNDIVIGGATYIDSMYTISANQTLATPSFNANPQAAAVCNSSGSDDDGNGDTKCKYSSSNNKVKIRSVSGAIDLKATLLSGAFGWLPLDGTTITTNVVYSLNDKSNKATQQLTVKLIYYFSRSNVPAALANSITASRNAFLQNQALRTAAPRPPVIVVSSSN